MNSPDYHSAVYKINSNKQIATRICFRDYKCELLPKELDFVNLAKLLSNMQKICFYDDNKKNNQDRIIDLLSSNNEKTFIVPISLGYNKNETNYKNFIDGGAATVQKTNLGFLTYQQPTINEVCRAKYKEVRTVKSPVSIIMELIEKYTSQYLMHSSKKTDGLYLYVEKNPDHGSPGFLLNYYKRYGFIELEHNDHEYFYMKKTIQSSITNKSK